jgi:arylsulfatase A-like enzyme
MMADDLGWGDVGYHGGRISTPHIDQLSKRGVRLNQFYVQPVCSPTRGALLTGRYPMRLGLQCGVVRPWATHGLPLDERTLPQALRQAGYVTAICGKWHLGHVTAKYLPTRRGFDHQYGHYNGALDYFTHIRDGGHDWHRDDRPNHDKGYSTNLIGKAASEIIAEHDKSRPLFLYVPFNAPHTPLQAPQEYIRKYADMPNKQRRIFAAMVTCMDDAIGRILKALDEHQYPAEKTLVIFCSDNGGIRRLGSNGELRAGKGTLYEGGVRVPAVMVWKGVLKPGSLVDEPLHIVDLYPTLLRLAGADVVQKKPLDGKDAWDTIAYGGPSPHEFLLHNVTPFHGAIRMGDWKLIHNGHVSANVTQASKKETWELFNIRRDPSEKQDVSRQQPQVTKRLKAKLAALAAEAVEPNIPPNKPPVGFQSPKVWGNAQTEAPPLFDGSTLANWTMLDGQPVTKGWEVIDGMIHLNTQKGRSGHIVTRHEYGDFTLAFEWKIASGGNSGLKYRVRKYGRKTLGCEYQIYDDGKKKLTPNKSAGSLYDLYEPNDMKQLKPAGEFNSSRIVVHGNKIEHWLNGKKILSAIVGDSEWKRRLAKSKFSDVDGFGENRFGQIMLTDHGSEVWYRNIRFEPMAVGPDAKTAIPPSAELSSSEKP